MNTPSTESYGVPAAGDLIGGKFRITETLGQGGMGVVLGGEHLDLRQAVAIKVLRPALAREPDALARFLREARAAASIRSRHAVRIYDVGTTEAGVPYIVMERLRGVGVDALLLRGALAVAEAVRIVVEAAEAISEANRLGVVHRDVKPSNLFLADDESGVPIVKVLDFGISKRITVDDAQASASLTAPHTLLGSPQYMSPEQLRDSSSVDERTDVWGLGVTLYELLTRRMPFECSSIPELCALIFNSTPARVDSLRSEVPSALSDVIDQCLVKRPEGRIPSVAALAAKLAPFCRTAATSTVDELARTIDVRPPASARSRQKPVLLGVAAAAVALGIALALVRARGESVNLADGSPSLPPDLRTPAVSASSPAGPVPSVAPPSAGDGDDASSAAPRVSTAQPATSRPPTLPPTGPRPRGLKGIKLID